MQFITVEKAYEGDEAAEWAALQEQYSVLDMAAWVRQVTLHTTRHAFTLTFRELVLLRDRKDHLALTALRLSALAGLVPVEAWPHWMDDPLVGQPVPAPPPLLGARTTTAPPARPMNASSRVKDFVTN
jgi:hypothetical protein